jgi:hypothetical protein
MAELACTSTVAPVVSAAPEVVKDPPVSLDLEAADVQVPLGFGSSGIGIFLGPKAALLKKFVLGPTRSEFPCQKFHVKIFTKEDDLAFAAIFVDGCPAAEALETVSALDLRIKKHAFITGKKLASKAREAKDASDGISTFVIKTRMEHFRIAKFIGNQGKNIFRLVAKINDLQEVVGARTNVNIQKERFVNRKNCLFYILENDETTDEHVLITVKTITKDRKTTWVAILDAVKSAIKPHIDYNSDYLNSGPAMDFLAAGSNASTTSHFGGLPLETTQSVDEPHQDSLDSPSYSPDSPSYTPSSPSYHQKLETINGW